MVDMKKLQGVFCCILLFVLFTSFDFSNTGYYIIIDKSKYELSVFDAQGWLATYPVVFGNRDLGDKMMAGDRKTPEGVYTIVSKRIHRKWDRFMMLDYPTKEDYAKFIYRKQRGLIPANAKPGGGIGIHGVWPHEDYTIDQYQNWTEGCISMKNKDVEELYNIIPVGTKIYIRK
jgi:murein L,D-transpeptidase YafK